MTYTRQTTEVDFGSTSIENIFINDFMPGAPGTYVKVYLMGYKIACDGDMARKASNKMLARHLSLPIDDVLRAWAFWEEKGIVRRIDANKEDRTDFEVEFLSLRQLFLDNNYRPLSVGKRKAPSKKAPAALKEDGETARMFETIEETIGRPLGVNEAVQISEYMEAYAMKPAMVLEAYALASQKRGIHATKYIGGILKNWYDKGILTPQALADHQAEQSALQVHYQSIFSALGFAGRNPSKAEKEAMDQWLLDWGFPIEMVLKACENTVYAARPSIRYIHSILAAWKKEGVRTLEDLEKADRKKPPKAATGRPKPANRFHNYKERSLDYTDKELKELLKKKNRP